MGVFKIGWRIIIASRNGVEKIGWDAGNVMKCLRWHISKVNLSQRKLLWYEKGGFDSPTWCDVESHQRKLGSEFENASFSSVAWVLPELCGS
jgi:hypothetical protein